MSKQKTILEWLEMLPDGYREICKFNYNPIFSSNKTPERLRDAINSLCNWYDTTINRDFFNDLWGSINLDNSINYEKLPTHQNRLNNIFSHKFLKMKHLILLFLLSFIGCTPHLIETEQPSTHSLVNDDMENITVSDPVILLISNSLCAPAPLIAAPDSDCDGVVDSLDVCPGINDKIDNNNDGKPDCKFPPTYNKVIPAWKCGTPSLQKVFVCFKTNSGGTMTICTPYAAVNTHIAAGNRLGICGSSKCGGL